MSLSLTTLVFVTLPLVGAAGEIVTSPRVDEAAHARVGEMVRDALARDPRLDVVVWDKAPVDTRCTRDPACLSRTADAYAARYVLFGQTGRGGALYYLLLDGYDVRLGTYAGRESVHTGTEGDLAHALDRMIDAVVNRLAIRADNDVPTRVLFLGMLDVPEADESQSVLSRIPWMVLAAGAMMTVGVVAQGVALGFLVAAVSRDQAAANADLQFDAYVIQRQRNLLTSLALMSGTVGLSFFTFAAMSATYGVLEEL
jgi:hypothetical protein